ncbi:MAG: SDR family oxidoreductase [Alphaproteobacteria bacterium]|nr:SDR family oxidoreductase [Alphaproteobacteria bacterium]
MDLGIAGKKALVCAASKGLGKACAKALAREGVAVTIAARTKETLDAAAAEIRAVTQAPVAAVVADVTTEAGRAAALKACPEPDILVNNAGGPPPGDFRDWSADDWLKALNNNMVSSIMLIKATVDGMVARKFVARHNVTINNLLPGPFETDRMLGTLKFEAQRQNRDWKELHAERARANPTGRLGDPDEFGALCAFVCSAHTGFIVGQSFLLDGGAFNATI